MTHEVPAKKKNWFARHKILTGLGLMIALVVAITSGSGGKDSGPASTTTDITDALSADTSLTFEVTGTARKGSVTWIGDKLSTSQETDAKFPWKKTVKYTAGTLGVNMNAQNTGSGTITCTIKENGKVISTNTSKGDYAVVSCAVA